jgi:hypothetical protein
MGSVGISAAAGAAGLMADNNNDIYIDALGPMVSLGIDWRFGF